MATDAFIQGSSHLVSQPAPWVLNREATQWFLARVADGHEATFALDVDERFWRARRVTDGCGSMIEAKLAAPLSCGDLVAALARWAAGAGLGVRTAHGDGALLVTLTRPAD